MMALWYLVTHTKLGLAMRAISYDRVATPLMGVPTDNIIVSTFVIGSSLAAFAAILFGYTSCTNITQFKVRSAVTQLFHFIHSN